MKPCKRMKPCNSHRDWSALPRNVILCIMDKLTVIEDFVRFGAACLPWRTIFLEEIYSGRPSCCCLPVLLVAPPADEDTETETESYRQQRAFYSLSRQRVYDFRLPVPHNKICRGSSFGWLITLETKALLDCHIQLQNPFLNRTIHLPPPDNILQLHPNDTQGQWDWYNVQKAVLSSDPSSSPDHFVVMAIMGKYHGLAYYKPGNTSWTSISIGDDDWFSEFCRNRLFADVIFFHKTKQFYALLTEGEVLAIDFLGDDHNPKITQVAPSPRFRGFGLYLLEDLSSGDLFQVYKDYADNWFFKRNSEKVVFTVFKLDTSNQNWIRVDNVGENVIFIGNSGSLLRAASECPGCEPNCIYYTDDDDITFRKKFNSCGLPWDGIYNLKNGTLQPHYSSAWSNMIRPECGSTAVPSAFAPCNKLLPQLIWLEPTLR